MQNNNRAKNNACSFYRFAVIDWL